MIMKVNISTEYEVDVSDFNPEWVDINGYAIDCAKQCFAQDMNDDVFSDDDFTYTLKGLWFDKPTQLKVEERTFPNDDLYCYGAIGFQDKIICMDNGHIHPTCAVGDYLTIVEKYDNWLNLSDEVLGN